MSYDDDEDDDDDDDEDDDEDEKDEDEDRRIKGCPQANWHPDTSDCEMCSSGNLEILKS